LGSSRNTVSPYFARSSRRAFSAADNSRRQRRRTSRRKRLSKLSNSGWEPAIRRDSEREVRTVASDSASSQASLGVRAEKPTSMPVS
jgi:hypothetical protein